MRDRWRQGALRGRLWSACLCVLLLEGSAPVILPETVPLGSARDRSKTSADKGIACRQRATGACRGVAPILALRHGCPGFVEAASARASSHGRRPVPRARGWGGRGRRTHEKNPRARGLLPPSALVLPQPPAAAAATSTPLYPALSRVESLSKKSSWHRTNTVGRGRAPGGQALVGRGRAPGGQALNEVRVCKTAARPSVKAGGVQRGQAPWADRRAPSAAAAAAARRLSARGCRAAAPGQPLSFFAAAPAGGRSCRCLCRDAKRQRGRRL